MDISKNNILSNVKETQHPELIGVDIFSGAGGLSLGAEMEGIKVQYAIELNSSAAKTFVRNHSGAKVICEDIRTLNPKEIIKDKNVFVIMGGPPCQGFSLSNTRNRTLYWRCISDVTLKDDISYLLPT